MLIEIVISRVRSRHKCYYGNESILLGVGIVRLERIWDTYRLTFETDLFPSSYLLSLNYNVMVSRPRLNGL